MNNFIKPLALLVIILLLPAISFAGTARSAQTKAETVVPTMNDFAHLYELKTTREGAIHVLPLTKSVYEGLVQSQRRDIAVFNSSGGVVPFTVREAAPTHSTYVLPQRRVPFYELPVDSRSENAIGQLDVYVKTDANGQVVSVKNDGRNMVSRERDYLLDFSSMKEEREATKHELRLFLPDEVISAKLSIRESTNLRDWRAILNDVPLIQLKNRSSRLTSDSVELPRAPQRYVLLRILDVEKSFRLDDIGYSVSVHRSSVKEEDAYIDGVVISDKTNETAVEYDLLGAFPISKLNFVLRDPGFFRVSYFSRPEVQESLRTERGNQEPRRLRVFPITAPQKTWLAMAEQQPGVTEAKNKWSARGKMEIFTIINQNGSARSNEDSPIDRREDRYWRIEFEGPFPGEAPKMKIIWRPGELLFLAQGGGPYVLAFGSEQKIFTFQDSSFLNSAQAILSEIGERANPAVNIAANEKAKPVIEDTEWQRYIVWGLLGASGLLLSVIAFKLIKK